MLIFVWHNWEALRRGELQWHYIYKEFYKYRCLKEQRCYRCHIISEVLEFSQKYTSHLKILGATKATWKQVPHSEDPRVLVATIRNLVAQDFYTPALTYRENRYTTVEKKNHLDATEWFIALIICSTCFGNFYAHHQELETICVLLPSMVCSAWLLVVGGQVQGSKLVSRKRDVARLALTRVVVQHPSSWTHSLLLCTWPPITSNQALHTIGGNNTHIV